MAWIPDRGDLVWVSFTPQAGREQAGHRPAVIVSPALYNRKSGLALMCPVTKHIKNYPFHVRLPEGLPVQGEVQSDQVRSLDWEARKAEFICRLPKDIMQEIMGKLTALLLQD